MCVGSTCKAFRAFRRHFTAGGGDANAWPVYLLGTDGGMVELRQSDMSFKSKKELISLKTDFKEHPIGGLCLGLPQDFSRYGIFSLLVFQSDYAIIMSRLPTP